MRWAGMISTSDLNVVRGAVVEQSLRLSEPAKSDDAKDLRAIMSDKLSYAVVILPTAPTFTIVTNNPG